MAAIALPLVCLISVTPAAAATAKAPPQAAPAQALRIGAIVPESWPSAAQGQEIRNGMLLALKVWPGRPAPTLEVKDSGCDPGRAKQAAQSMIDAKVDVVLGAWCVIGTVPAQLKAAGVPFVSNNAERHPSADAAAQFGRIPATLPEQIASRLRAETGLRVTANSACWIDFEARVSDKWDAALCPALQIDKAMWDEVAPTYSAAFMKPLTVSAARGYAAMQVALAYGTRLRAGVKPAVAWSEAQQIKTILGTLPAKDAATPQDAMQLVFGARLPKLPARETAALNQLGKAKACGCKAGADCAADPTWSGMPFTMTGAAAPACAPNVASR